MTRHDLFEEPMLAAVGPGHPLAGRRSIRLPELADDAWTMPTRDGLIYHACRDAGFEPDIRYQTSDPFAIQALVVRGLAVTLTPRMLAPNLLGMATPAITKNAPSRSVYAIVPPSMLHPLVGPVLDALATPTS